MYSNDYTISDTLYPYGKREIEIIFENGDKKQKVILPIIQNL